MTKTRRSRLFGIGFLAGFILAFSGISASAAQITCGGVDDTAAIQAAINTGYPEWAPRQNCVATNLVQTVDNTIYEGHGSTITMIAGATGYLLNTGTFSRTIRDLNLNGGDPLVFWDGTGTIDPNDKRWWPAFTIPTVNRNGLLTAPQATGGLFNVQVENFQRKCIDTAPLTNDSIYNFDIHMGTAAIRLRNCWLPLDINVARAGEYTTWDDISVSASTWVARVSAPNVNIGTITASNNGNCLWLDGITGGAQDGHGNIGNAICNHNVGYSIYADNVDVGFRIRGQFHLGDIYFKNSTGIDLSGEIQAGKLLFSGGGVNKVHDAFMYNNPPSLPNTVVHDYNETAGGPPIPDKTVLVRNYTKTGPFPDSIGSGLSSWPSGNITLTSQSFTPNFTCGDGASLASRGASVTGSGTYSLDANGELGLWYDVTVNSYGSCAGGISATLPAFVSAVPRPGMQLIGKEFSGNCNAALGAGTIKGSCEMLGYVVSNIVNFNTDANVAPANGWHWQAWGKIDLN